MSPHPNTSHPTCSPSQPRNTYEFCFSRCRTFLCSSWFWAVHADILGQGSGMKSGTAGGAGKEQSPPGATLGVGVTTPR